MRDKKRNRHPRLFGTPFADCHIATIKRGWHNHHHHEKGQSMKNRNRRETQTVEGILTPCAWDDDGGVLEMVIQATDEETYRIENSEFFLKLVGKYIQAAGAISTSKKGEKRISIKKIVIMENDRTAVAPIP
jgi:hypothetical protein